MRLQLYRGKYCVYWRDDSGQPVRRSLGTADRSEAERRYAEFNQLQLVRASNPQGKLIAQLWEERREKLKGRRMADNMRYSGLPIIKFFGHLEPRHVSQELCRQYIKWRSSQGRQAGTIHTELSHLRSVLNGAKAGGDVVRPALPPPKDLYLTKEQAKELIDASTGHLRLYIILALGTGARNGALLDLTWDRVDLQRRLIELRTEDMVHRKGRATVPINTMLYEALSTIEHREGPVIQWMGNKVLSVKKSLKKAADKIGLPWISPHVFRHSAAVWMAEGNVPMEQIAQYLGHRNVDITRRVYAKYSPEYLRHAAKELDLT